MLEIRFGGYQGPASVHTRAAQVFGQELKKRLADRVQFEFQENIIEHGHNAADLLTMVEDGTLSMCYFSTSYLADRVPEFALLDLPFTYTDRDSTYAILDGEVGQHLGQELLRATGFRILGLWDNGFRHFSNSQHTIAEPADCAGMTIRTLFSDLHSQVFNALGFAPQALDVKDLLEGVRSGRIVAQENPLTNTYNFEMYKFHRFITLSSHIFGAAALLCNKEAYEGWDDDVRDAVTQSAAAATLTQRQLAAQEDDLMLEKLLAKGVEVTTLNEQQRAKFVDAVGPIIQDQKNKFGERLFALTVN
ncbi:MAG: TRAP transporter substrate-binding protein [Proteobacteria bacterium]|jgi:TRAP-type transport system periplasmic protein|nr:TRAP transporter substrate-binding protein [Pseudomonadota bacterium]